MTNPNSNKKILVVDDHEAVRDGIASLLRSSGYDHVDTAVDGIDAIARFTSASYDCVISDMRMQNLDGIGLLKWLRKQEDYVEVKFILHSFGMNKLLEAEALQSGASVALSKADLLTNLLPLLEKIL